MQTKQIQKKVPKPAFAFVNELRKVNIKIALLRAIMDILVYTKTVQDLCTCKQKKKMNPKTVQVIGKLADLMLGNLSIPKYADPRSPMIKVCIGNIIIPNTLFDLGMVINVMTNETKEKLSLKGLRPPPIVLQMADQSLVKP